MTQDTSLEPLIYMRKLKGFLVLALLAFSATVAMAWSSGGHQVVAAGTYRQLSPELKTKVSNILKEHPKYEEWKRTYRTEDNSMDLETYVFLRASVWPDEIRQRDNPYHHPHWHYIDYPLKPRKFPFEPNPDPDDDILFAITKSEETLASRKTSRRERAIYLSWLIHLIGDLHQPLHCASLFSSAYPHGDKGGNDFFVKPGDHEVNLHSFWDGLLGTSGKAQTHWNYAVALETEYPRKSLKEIKNDRLAKEWSLEGRTLAIDKAYLRGDLKGSLDRDNAVALPTGYAKAAKTVAEKQGALAGYRLADEIEKYVR